MNRRGFLGALAAAFLGAKLLDHVELTAPAVPAAAPDDSIYMSRQLLEDMETQYGGGVASIDEGAYEATVEVVDPRTMQQIWAHVARDMKAGLEWESDEWDYLARES